MASNGSNNNWRGETLRNRSFSDLKNVSFANATLDRVQFTENVKACSFHRARLSQVHFGCRKLHACALTDAIVSRSDFNRVEFVNVDVAKTLFDEVSFYRCDLRGMVNAHRATWQRCDFTECDGAPHPTIPATAIGKFYDHGRRRKFVNEPPWMLVDVADGKLTLLNANNAIVEPDWMWWWLTPTKSK